MRGAQRMAFCAMRGAYASVRAQAMIESMLTPSA